MKQTYIIGFLISWASFVSAQNIGVSREQSIHTANPRRMEGMYPSFSQATTQPGSVSQYDDFSRVIGNWHLFRGPAPVWANSAFGRQGIFDNNGNPNYNSRANSNQDWFKVTSNSSLSGNSSGWAIGVSAKTSVTSDSTCYAGVESNATDGYDSTLDLPKPPIPPSNYVYAYFPHPDWSAVLGPNFLSDVKADSDLTSRADVWMFTVATDQQNKTMTVSLSPNDSVPASYPIMLRDMKTGVVTDIRNSSSYTYNTGADGSRSFQLIVGTPYASVSHTYNAGWNMVGVPLKADTSTKSAVFGTSSYMFGYSTTGYFTSDTISIGEGYWLGTTSPVTAETRGIQVLGGSNTELEPGFNMISIPYLDSAYTKEELGVTRGDTTVSLDSAASLGWISPTVYGYDPSTGNYEMRDTLTSWEGYWFASLDSNVTLVYNPPVDNVIQSSSPKGVASKKETVAGVSNTDWGLHVGLSVGGFRDDLGQFGVKQDAKNGFDARYDYPHPPSPPSTGAYAYLVFPHPEWNVMIGPNFCTDFNSPSNLTPWKMVAGYTGGKATGVLRWDPNSIPSGVSLILTDLGNQGSSVDMRSSSSYSFAINGADSFSVSSTLTGVNGDGLNLPANYALYQNYPNPFNPSTTITFDLKETSSVMLEIYNVLGERVLEVDYGTMSGGEYIRNIDLSSFASGVYFYRLTAQGNNGDRFVAVKKLLLMK